MTIWAGKPQWARANCACCLQKDAAWVIEGAVQPMGNGNSTVRCAACRARCLRDASICNVVRVPA